MRPEPLRPHDPARLGSYELVGRLGEGGMGTVYLARTAAGAQVAVKVVRADLSPDDEFRRRFRSEVARARQVPPFCTAEVLDADPDAEHPYLVVEYVDGPTLAQVVDERGPLTAANLHSVAIGVATALTAIHGAGVIHRDLKPRNVLLAPGTPKVIDFGIARAVGGTATGNTAPEFMMGTVAYMAPERFGDAEVPLTAAADIFAWGGVVMYAGTGRTPFGGDSPLATAGRILTQQPDLSGLSGPLRELVSYALSKDPADRPSARELLDMLVAGPSRPAATAAALAGQPDLRAAANQAQSVTGLLTAPAPDEPPAPEGPTVQVSAVPGMVEPDHESRSRRWFLPAAIALLVLAVIAGSMMLVFGSPADQVAGPGATVPATESPLPSAPPAGPLLLADDLDRNRLWLAKTEPDGKSSCVFTGGELHVRIDGKPLYKCRGPQDTLPDDLSIDVGVRLVSDGACAAIWYHFKLPRGGHLVRICQDNIFVGTHQSADVSVTRTLPLDNPIQVGGPPVRIGLHVAGDVVTVSRDGVALGEAPLGDAEITGNRVLLGVFLDRDTPDSGSAEVAFDHIEVREPGRPGPR